MAVTASVPFSSKRVSRFRNFPRDAHEFFFKSRSELVHVFLFCKNFLPYPWWKHILRVVYVFVALGFFLSFND